jgi:iron complex outermembrane receptor protein
MSLSDGLRSRTGCWVKWGLLVLSLLLLLPTGPAQAQRPTLTGTVVDARDGAPLIGATVVLRETSTSEVVVGTTTDPNGNFQVAGVSPGKYALEVRFIGYRERQIPLTLEAGDARDLRVELELATESLETIVVSASRRREKVLDAPASITVLQPEQIRREVTTSSVEALRSAPGVDMAQTGVDRREVALRGFNEAFASGIHVLTDYRETSVPALGVNAYSVMPSIPLDLSRVEVVRGPGSALYGPGVDSGVIHFFTKDPFQHPGTAVSVAGGSRAFVSAQARQAGVLGDNVGYKVTAQFSRADEWELNPGTPQDAAEIARYRVYQNPNDPALEDRNFATGDFDGDGQPEAQLRREDLYFKYNLNGALTYRFGGETSLTLDGGYSALKSTFQSGVGTLQTDGFGFSYGQLRFESGNLFAQVYLNQNHSTGGTYVYGSGRSTVDEGLQWNGQAQYAFALDALDTEVVTGADVNLTRPRTEGTVLGRNEDRDDINEYGAYAQTTTELASPLSLTLAGRADYNNVVGELQLSPRAALVFNVTDDHSVRASYNQAFSSPSVNSLFLDVPSQRRSLGDNRDLVFQGLGAADGFSFSDFRETRTARFFLPDVPGLQFGTPVSLSNYPVKPVYGATAADFRTRLNRGTLPGRVGDLSSQAQRAYASLLGIVARETPAAATVSETGTVLGVPDDSDLGYRPVDGPTDVDPLGQTTTQTIEVGYKGTIADRIRLSVDGYYERKEDFVGPLRVESPLVYLDPQFVSSDLQQKVASNPTVGAAFQEFRRASGLSQEQAFELLTGTVGRTASAVVQPNESVLPSGSGSNAVGALFTYRTFGEIEYWGLDASVEVNLTETFTAFGNVSYVSDDFFDNQELDEADESLSLALNAPAFKTKGGVDYGLPAGFSVGATVHYVDGFPVRSGPYVGDVEAYTLLDVRAAYNVPVVPGLRLTLTGKNVLDNRHREFVGAPPLGRMLMGRLTYELP